MSFENFKPEIWATQLILDRDARVVGVQHCWQLFDGAINRRGDRVHIQGLTGATVKDLPTTGVIDDPEGILDTDLQLLIDQKKYINFKVDDIDKIQSNPDAITAIIGKTANNLAVIQDKYIYNLAKDNAGKVIDATKEGATLSSKNVLSYLSDALAFIRSNDVYDNGEIYFEVHPYVFSKLQLAFTMIGQANDGTSKNGYRGPLFGCHVYESNSIAVTDSMGNPVEPGSEGAVYHNIIRTGEAIAFAESKSVDFKAYQVEKGFSEGVKGFTLYGAKVVKPNELVCLKASIAAD